jgi:hypothetical protein
MENGRTQQHGDFSLFIYQTHRGLVVMMHPGQTRVLVCRHGRKHETDVLRRNCPSRLILTSDSVPRTLPT